MVVVVVFLANGETMFSNSFLQGVFILCCIFPIFFPGVVTNTSYSFMIITILTNVKIVTILLNVEGICTYEKSIFN